MTTKLPKCSKTLHFEAMEAGKTATIVSEGKTNKAAEISGSLRDFAV
jgi:hypothetical protein